MEIVIYKLFKFYYIIVYSLKPIFLQVINILNFTKINILKKKYY
jgi:hypothetical protein